MRKTKAKEKKIAVNIMMAREELAILDRLCKQLDLYRGDILTAGLALYIKRQERQERRKD